MLFINTRPLDRGGALTQRLLAAGYNVIDMPLLVLKPRPFDQQLNHLYQHLHQVQVIVVVSPTAVDVGMQYLREAQIDLTHLSHIQWVAVGQSTAQCLERHGISSHQPEVETSEGMLSLPLFRKLKPMTKVAFWRGEGGRQFMMQQCLAQQIEVLNFVLYERDCPSETRQNIFNIGQQIKQFAPPYWACISSEASWKNWLQLFQDQPYIVQSCHYLVLGERLYKLLNDDKYHLKLNFDLTQVDRLNPDTILQAIKQQ